MNFHEPADLCNFAKKNTDAISSRWLQNHPAFSDCSHSGQYTAVFCDSVTDPVAHIVCFSFNGSAVSCAKFFQVSPAVAH